MDESVESVMKANPAQIPAHAASRKTAEAKNVDWMRPGVRAVRVVVKAIASMASANARPSVRILLAERTGAGVPAGAVRMDLPAPHRVPAWPQTIIVGDAPRHSLAWKTDDAFAPPRRIAGM